MNFPCRLIVRHLDLVRRIALLALFLFPVLLSIPAKADDLFVGQGNLDLVKQYTDQGILVADPFATLTAGDDPQGLRFGPNGNLYVANFLTNNVKEFDGTSGAYIQTISNALFGRLSDVAFDTSGNMFVADLTSNFVRKVDATTGTILDSYSVAGAAGLVFHQNGDLLATSYATGKVFAIDTTSGSVSEFATGALGAFGIAAGLDGRYYVAGYGEGKVDVIAAGGGSASLFATIHGSELFPKFLTFTAGKMYVTVSNPGTVQRFDASTGLYETEFSTGDANVTGITTRNSTSAVPEPAFYQMSALLGLGVLGVRRLRRQRK